MLTDPIMVLYGFFRKTLGLSEKTVVHIVIELEED